MTAPSARVLTRAGHALLIWLVAAVFMAPVIWMVAASFKPGEAIHDHVSSLRSFIPQPFTTDNYVEASRQGEIGVKLANSTIQVVAVVVLGVLINSIAAYAFARLRFVGRDVVFMVLVATIIVPLEAIVIPLYLTVHLPGVPGDAEARRAWTLAALSIPFVAKAFNVFLLRQAFLSLPRALEEAALLDGASWLRIFWSVALPNVRHALVTVAVLDIVLHWNDFLWPLVVCLDADTRTIQLGLANFFTQRPQWGAIMAYAVIATLPVTLVFAVGQRWIVRSLAPSGVRG